jgi:hypothetical protein
MLKNQSTYNIEWLCSGMHVANIEHVSFVSIVTAPISKTY